MKEIDEWLKVVAKFKKSLRLHEGDAKYILNRFNYLKQRLGPHGTRGIPDVKLLLTSIYCYTNTPSYGRKIVSPAKFVSLCDDFEFEFTRKDIWRYEQLYFQYNFYPRASIPNAISYFEAAWYDISKDLGLPEMAKDQVLTLLKGIHELEGPRPAPRTVVGAAIYLIGEKTGNYFTQKELAYYFGIHELSLRNAAKAFKSCLKAIQF